MSNQWVLSLKVGDLVAVDHGRFGSIKWYIRKVSEIKTPKPARKRTAKEVVRVDSVWFDEEGQCNGPGAYDSGPAIYPVTAEIRALVRRRRILELISATDWEKLSTDDLDKIAALIPKGGGDPV